MHPRKMTPSSACPPNQDYLLTPSGGGRENVETLPIRFELRVVETGRWWAPSSPDTKARTSWDTSTARWRIRFPSLCGTTELDCLRNWTRIEASYVRFIIYASLIYIPRNIPTNRARLILTPIISSRTRRLRSSQKLSSMTITELPSTPGKTSACWQAINLKVSQFGEPRR